MLLSYFNFSCPPMRYRSEHDGGRGRVGGGCGSRGLHPTRSGCGNWGTTGSVGWVGFKQISRKGSIVCIMTYKSFTLYCSEGVILLPTKVKNFDLKTRLCTWQFCLGTSTAIYKDCWTWKEEESGMYKSSWSIHQKLGHQKKILKHHFITYGFCHSEAMAN